MTQSYIDDLLKSTAHISYRCGKKGFKPRNVQALCVKWARVFNSMFSFVDWGITPGYDYITKINEFTDIYIENYKRTIKDVT